MCRQLSYIETNSLSRLKGSRRPFRPAKLTAEPRSVPSKVVNIPAQAVHLRRRQILLVRIWGRELTTIVGDPQYMHSMTIYCHGTIRQSSGKVGDICGWAQKKEPSIAAEPFLITLLALSPLNAVFGYLV